MARFGFTGTVAGLLLAILIGGCSLIVDFDRSLLDSGMDGGVDAGLDGAVDATVDAGEDAAADAAAEAG